ncbi:E3 ubiquitin-protein ligase UBR2-like [Pollicipes pollicipes]|uniref:E3 ubiquitin-protein ligase UBR2-like n=1 Tax=Pollicipes pollicipes TaxID=41117 RepID=UPI0018856B7B|nr:E3 ubiquitin-protein ligase UBR2-like [Pollicipes pollicipes]XP_037087333.1 E3 ubiquitin-protein ligase UBR2-like [Pollicipes pollicipes]
MDVAELARQEPMETDGEPADQDEQQWLAELYTLVRSAAGIDVADVSPPLLRQYIVSAVTPFLRCCALYFHLLTGVRAPAELQQALPLTAQLPHLLRYLGLDSLCVPQATDCHSALYELVFRWCRHSAASLAQTPVRLFSPGRVSRLIDLPHEYSDLIIQASSFRCECGESDAALSPVLCLVCGVMLCSDVACTRDRLLSRRGMEGHALSCGAGVGLLLLVRRCKLYLVHSVADAIARKALFPPPYVDRFGEVDQGLRRSNPLTLQLEQYAKLNRLWLSHGVSDEVTRYMEEFSSGMILD